MADAPKWLTDTSREIATEAIVAEGFDGVTFSARDDGGADVTATRDGKSVTFVAATPHDMQLEAAPQMAAAYREAFG
jgi:hypothetical protein